MKKILLLSFILIVIACNQTEEKAVNRCTGTAAPALALGDNRETNILTKDFWVIEYYIGVRDFETQKSNRGKWYKFLKNGTFASGHWGERGCDGTWTIDYSTQYPLVILDSYDDNEDVAWHIQAVTPDLNEMSLVGGNGYSNYSDMVKAVNLLTMPTKKQFGDE